MRDFRKLEIWQKGIELVEEIYLMTRDFPDTEKFGLISQMQRAAVSIPSNIAEGCSRHSEIEYKRFLEIAIGSSFELETQIIISNMLGYIHTEQSNKTIQELNTLQKQINSLITIIAKSHR
jgi:four helix bundle protein